MPHELAPATILQDRYEIVRSIAEMDHGCVYLAHDRKVGGKCVLREIIPSQELEADALAQRKHAFLEVLDSVMHFEHPNLVRIFDHFEHQERLYMVADEVQGVTLQAIRTMSANALSEGMIIGWALQICEALEYCQARPRPFVFAVLTARHAMLDSGEQIRLVNYGLDRFFAPGSPPRFFSDSPDDVQANYRCLGELLTFLLGGDCNAADPRKTFRASNILTRVVGRCLGLASTKPYASIAALKEELHQALHPPAAEQEAEPAPEAASTKWPGAMGVLGGGWLSRLLSPKVLAVLALVALGALVAALGSSGDAMLPYRKSGPTAYVVTGDNQLTAVRYDTGKVVDRKNLDMVAGDLQPDPQGRWLYVAEQSGERIFRMDVTTNGFPATDPSILVDQGPSRMALDASGSVMFVVHPAQGKISRIDLKQEPPQVDKTFSTGHSPRALALAPDGKSLYVANAEDKSLSILDSVTGTESASVTLPASPTSVAVSPDGKQVWVGCQYPDGVVVVATEGARAGVPMQRGVREPGDLAFSPDGRKVYLANSGAGNVLVFDASAPRLLSALAVGGRPQRMIATPGGLLWVTCMGKKAVSVIDPASDKLSEVPLGALPLGPAAVVR